MRKLATLDRVSAIEPANGLDNLEFAIIRGWRALVRKNAFAPGDLVVFFEPDSALPLSDPVFMRAVGDRKRHKDPVTGAEVHVVKTMKLRGNISQGLVISPVEWWHLFSAITPEYGRVEQMDVTEMLGVYLWEPPAKPQNGAKLGAPELLPWPAYLPKTDQERVQNIASYFPLVGDWVPTEKIDGCSVTYALIDGELQVFSRNYRIPEKFKDQNDLWRYAVAHDIENSLFLLVKHFSMAYPGEVHDVAVQGELFGPGIQGNPLAVPELDYRVFNILLCNKGDFNSPFRLCSFSETSFAISKNIEDGGSLRMVPVIRDRVDSNAVDSALLALGAASGIRSAINPDKAAEGVVWRNCFNVYSPWGMASFKAVSPTYLLTHDRG